VLAPALGAPRAVSAASLAKKVSQALKTAKRADKNAKRALRQAKTGPAGPKGDRGARSSGHPGRERRDRRRGVEHGRPRRLDGSEQTVRSISLPAGKYVFNATAFGNNDDPDDEQSFGCRIVAGAVSIAQNTALILAPQTGGIDHASSRGQYALTTGTTLTAPTEVSLRCTASSADGMWQGVGLSAVRIG
jgi:hypothetical protein